jgi:hypothetical protein
VDTFRTSNRQHTLQQISTGVGCGCIYPRPFIYIYREAPLIKMPRKQTGRFDDGQLDDVVSKSMASSIRRYGHICAGRLRVAAANIKSLDTVFVDRLIEGVVQHATTNPISFETSLSKVGEPIRTDQSCSITLYDCIHKRRLEMTQNHKWIAVANEIFNDTSHSFHVNASAECRRSGSLLIANTEAQCINFAPTTLLVQCATCGCYETSDSSTACACGSVRCCSPACLHSAANALRHDCFKADERKRRACVSVILAQPDFPFTNLLLPDGRAGIPVTVFDALNLLHHMPVTSCADIGDEARRIIIEDCHTVIKMLQSATRRASFGICARRHVTRPISSFVESEVRKKETVLVVNG